MPDHTLHDLFADGHGGVQAGHGVLEDHGNALAVDVAADILLLHFQNIDGFGGAVVVVIGKLDGSAVYPAVFGKNAHGGLDSNGFAGTGLAHNGKRFTPV